MKLGLYNKIRALKRKLAATTESLKNARLAAARIMKKKSIRGRPKSSQVNLSSLTSSGNGPNTRLDSLSNPVLTPGTLSMVSSSDSESVSVDMHNVQVMSDCSGAVSVETPSPVNLHSVAGRSDVSSPSCDVRTHSINVSIPGISSQSSLLSGQSEQSVGCETRNLTTPEKEAHDLMRSENISPTKQPRIAKELVAFNALASHVSSASKKVKMELLSTQTHKKVPKCKSILAKKLGLNRHSVLSQRRSRAAQQRIFDHKKTTALQFFRRPDNSTPLPGRKDSLGRGTIQRYTLNDTIANLYSKFIEEYPEMRMSRATFARQRPKYMKPILWATRRQCLCVRHQNAALKLRILKQNRSPDVFLREHSDDDIQVLLNAITSDVITFSEWKNDQIMYEGKLLKKTRLKECTLPKSEFVSKFSEEFSALRHHVRRIKTQYVQLSNLRNSLDPLKAITCQMDYAENYGCVYQDEPSSLYYDRNQITVHPMVIHFKNEEGEVQHKSFVGLSAETSHSAPTCLAFLLKLIPKVKAILPDLDFVHYISDSPASQYRNKTAIDILAKHTCLFGGIHASWDFLETGHGKGPCDGVGGTFKKTAELAVKSGTLISSAQQMYEWATSDRNTNMEFILVTPEDIKHAESKVRNAVPVKGISTVHSLRPSRGSIWMRETSCYEACCKYNLTCADWQDTGILVQQHIEIDVRSEEPTLSVDQQQQPVENVKYKVGMMIQAKYLGKLYVGEIVQYNDEVDECCVNFMVKVKGNYRWPEEEDILWIKSTKIVKQVFLDNDGKILKDKIENTPSTSSNTRSKRK